MMDFEAGYKVASRDRLVAVLAQILGFGLRWHAEPEQLLAAYNRHQIAPTPPDGNEWLQIIYLVTGRLVPEAERVSFAGERQLVKFAKGTKLAKYAGALRLLCDEDIHPDQVPDFVRHFEVKYPGYGALLDGMIQKDRLEHNVTRRDMFAGKQDQLASAAEDIVRRNLGDLEADWSTTSEPRFAVVWGVWLDGKFFPGGETEGGESRAKGMALRASKGGAK